MIIGLVGKKGSGKTTVANIATKRGYLSVAFADAIKKMASKTFNISLEILNHPVDKDNMQISIELTNKLLEQFLLELSTNYVTIHPQAINEAVALYKGPEIINTPRQLLQVLGTDLVRDCVDKEYWLKAALARVDSSKNIIIHDVRFQNECDFIKDHGGVIAVINRPGIQALDAHISEQLTPREYEYNIDNNSGLQDLTAQVLNIITLAEKNLWDETLEIKAKVKTYAAS